MCMFETDSKKLMLKETEMDAISTLACEFNTCAVYLIAVFDACNVFACGAVVHSYVTARSCAYHLNEVI
jgi:hypothetical protein